MTLKLELSSIENSYKSTSLGIYQIVNKDGIYKHSDNQVTKIKIVTAGKVRNQTPRWECCLGKERHKISGRANKRMKYKKRFLCS